MFFALLAITMGSSAWRLRGSLHMGNGAAVPVRLWLFAGFSLLFGYFALSGFIRAALIERRAASNARS